MRDSTIIYRSFYEAIIELPEADQAPAWRAVFEYALNFKLVETQGIAGTIFKLIKPQLEANLKRYKSGLTPKEKRKVSETQAKGKRKVSESKKNRSETEANLNLNPNPNLNVNLNENAGVVFPFNSEDFLNHWKIWLRYRQEIKKPYKSKSSEQMALKCLSGFDETFSIHLIKRSISNGWQGLIFEATQKEYDSYIRRNGKIENNYSKGKTYDMYDRLTAELLADGIRKHGEGFINDQLAH